MIHPYLLQAYEFITTNGGSGGKIELIECECNGHPTAAIVSMLDEGDHTKAVPLFIAPVSGLDLRLPDGTKAIEGPIE